MALFRPNTLQTNAYCQQISTEVNTPSKQRTFLNVFIWSFGKRYPQNVRKNELKDEFSKRCVDENKKRCTPTFY